MLINEAQTVDELPMKKIFHLWARLNTDSTINEVISLNRAELFKSEFSYTVKVF